MTLQTDGLRDPKPMGQGVAGALGGFRLGVDVGGTFTDLVLTAPDGAATVRKVLSATDDYATAILSGVVELLGDAGITGAQITEVLHGTTVATNAILERRGANTALLTTQGFRDVLEIGRLRLARLYDLDFERPAPLVARRWRCAVSERMDHRGRVVKPLDLSAVRRDVDRLVSEGVEAIAVCLLHSYANDEHEQAIGDVIRDRAPDIALTLSSELLPVVGEFERTSTAVTNAYVMPMMGQYLERLEEGLLQLGVAGAVLVMQSNGGVMAASEARRRPVHVIESGPAAGVIAAAELTRQIDRPNAISIDIGGTTAKAAVIENFDLTRTAEFEIGGSLSQGSRLNSGSGFLLRVPAIDIAEIGAGGGSIIRVDDAGQLHVGPISAGAVPGPACYDQGGTEATLTDANVVLGYLNHDRLPSGLRLDVVRARDAIYTSVAKPLGLGLLEAAHGAFLIGCARMARAVRTVTIERGRDPGNFALIAFGGNGPLFATEMAQLLGVGTVIVPPAPGVFSAAGLLAADIEHHAVRTFLRPLNSEALLEIDAVLKEIEAEAVAVLGGDSGGQTVNVSEFVDLKYEGQAYELTVALPKDWRSVDAASLLEVAFAREHERTYGHAPLGDPVRLVNLRVTARVQPTSQRRPSRFSVDVGGTGLVRDAYFGEFGLIPTPVIGRVDLSHEPLFGPLFVEEYDATTRVPPMMTARLDQQNNIIIEQGK